MLFCEACRREKNYPKHNGHPYIGITNGTCEICHGRNVVCHDVPERKLHLQERTSTDRLLDQIINDAWKQKAEDLQIAYVDSGRRNEDATAMLKEIKVFEGKEVDWETTYQLRRIAQSEYHRREEMKRDRR